MSFDKWLKEQQRLEEEAAKADAPSEPAPDELGQAPDDPFAKYIGRRDGRGLGADTAFAKSLEAVAEQKPEGFEFTVKPSETHDWRIKQAAVFSSDNSVWTCSKCLRTVNVLRSETIASALKKINVSDDCGQVIVQEVQEM
jgi:hypothetical protein